MESIPSCWRVDGRSSRVDPVGVFSVGISGVWTPRESEAGMTLGTEVVPVTSWLSVGEDTVLVPKSPFDSSSESSSKYSSELESSEAEDLSVSDSLRSCLLTTFLAICSCRILSLSAAALKPNSSSKAPLCFEPWFRWILAMPASCRCTRNPDLSQCGCSWQRRSRANLSSRRPNRAGKMKRASRTRGLVGYSGPAGCLQAWLICSSTGWPFPADRGSAWKSTGTESRVFRLQPSPRACTWQDGPASGHLPCRCGSSLQAGWGRMLSRSPRIWCAAMVLWCSGPFLRTAAARSPIVSHMQRRRRARLSARSRWRRPCRKFLKTLSRAWSSSGASSGYLPMFDHDLADNCHL